MSFRGGRKPDVAAQLSATKERYRCGVPLAGGIRSPKCFDYMGIWYKTEGFKDTDCHGHKWPRNDNA